MCSTDQKWIRIGYIVSELTGEVHDAIAKNDYIGQICMGQVHDQMGTWDVCQDRHKEEWKMEFKGYDQM